MDRLFVTQVVLYVCIEPNAPFCKNVQNQPIWPLLGGFPRGEQASASPALGVAQAEALKGPQLRPKPTHTPQKRRTLLRHSR